MQESELIIIIKKKYGKKYVNQTTIFLHPEAHIKHKKWKGERHLFLYRTCHALALYPTERFTEKASTSGSERFKVPLF